MVAVVDDDQSVRTATRGVLESIGLTVMPYASAEDFLAAKIDGFACLITDLKMPGIDGLELQRRLIAQGRKVPIIFLSAYGASESRSRALDAGALAFLDKPFDDDVLIEIVKKAVSEA